MGAGQNRGREERAQKGFATTATRHEHAGESPGSRPLDARRVACYGDETGRMVKRCPTKVSQDHCHVAIMDESSLQYKQMDEK